jgi:hypothetical protein
MIFAMVHPVVFVDNVVFQIAILRSVTSNDSDIIINLPWGYKWSIALELPDASCYVVDNICDSDVGNYCPVIKSIFEFIESSELPFDLCESSRLVCYYLKAFESGYIDTLFCPERDVVFILDSSKSMGAANRFDICKNSLKSILSSILTPADSVGLIVFNHKVLADVNISKLDARHKKRILLAIDSATPSGGTMMWTTMSTALSRLNSSSCGIRL